MNMRLRTEVEESDEYYNNCLDLAKRLFKAANPEADFEYLFTYDHKIRSVVLTQANLYFQIYREDKELFERLTQSQVQILEALDGLREQGA